MQTFPAIACAAITASLIVLATAPATAAPSPVGGPSCAEAMHIPLPPTGAAAIGGVLAEGEAHYYSFDMPPDAWIAFLLGTVHLGWSELSIHGPDCAKAAQFGFSTPNFGGFLPADFTGPDGGRWVLGVHLVDAALGQGAYTMEILPCPFDSPNPCVP